MAPKIAIVFVSTQEPYQPPSTPENWSCTFTSGAFTDFMITVLDVRTHQKARRGGEERH
jgi:hypothetical protein